MNTKNIKNLYIISVISLVIVLALAFAMTSMFEQKLLNNTTYADTINVTTFESSDGYMYDSSNKIISTATDGYELVDGKYHMTSAKIDAVYGTSNVTKISTGAGLLDFINNATNESIGVLTASFTYDMPTLNVVASSKEFSGILDGNAYTVTMKPRVGGTCIDDNFISYGELFSESRNYYYTGMLMGANRGTVKNLNIDWITNSNGELSVNATLTSSNATLVNRSSYSTGNDCPTVAGVICGINYGGTISNCNVTLSGAFAVGQAARYRSVTDSRTQLQYNSCLVGGICGALYSGTITRTTLINEGGVLALADGSRDGVGNKTAGAVAGGIAAIIRSGSSAKIVNCSIAGEGSVIAMCGHDVTNRNNDGSWGLSGGAVAGDVYVQSTSFSNRSLEAGQISGLVSAWTGARTNIWKEDGNIEIKNIQGCLFDVIGETTGAVSQVVMLFDYIGLAQANGSTYTTIDSNGKLAYGSWAEIYAKNDDGSLTVSYDYSKDSTKLIRVEAIARDFVADGIETCTDDLKRYEFEAGQKGYFIWSLDACTDTRGEVSSTVVDPQDSYGAYLYYVSPYTEGALVFTFGEKATFTYQNNNTQQNTANYLSDSSKYYDGLCFQTPTPRVKRGNNDYLHISTDAYAENVTYTINSTTYPVEDLAKIYLPGDYTVTPKITVEGHDYAYYDTTSYVLVDYDATDANMVYSYTINSGRASLFNMSVNSSSTSWLQSDTITFNYANKANTIDYYTYAMGNDAQSSMNPMTANEVNGTINVTTSGKYYYTVVAYLLNPYFKAGDSAETQYIKVSTNSIQAFIDAESPEIKNVRYYLYSATAEDNKGDQITELELLDWQYDDIIVSYEVRDNNLSGVESGSGHIKYTKVNDSRWDCLVRLTGTNSTQTVYYEDAAGNEVEQTFTAKIDTTQTDLKNVKALNKGEYLSYYGQLGYCPTTVKISFTPVFGASGAYLQYAYQKNASGEPIWVTYEKALKSNQPNTFVIDFEMEDQTLQMRLVSKEGMYADVYANGDGYVTNGAEEYQDSILWNVKIVIAGIGITLDNLFYSNTALSSMSADALNSLFNKSYDASGISSVALTAKIYTTGTDLISGTTLIYSDQYLYTEPAIKEEYLQVVATYESANAGTWDVFLSVNSIGDYYNKYLVRFINGTTTTNLKTLTTDNENFPIEKKIAKSTIAKATLNVNLADYSDQVLSSYEYGMNIPSQITIAGVGEDIVLDLVTDAKITINAEGVIVYPNAGAYSTSVKFATANPNYELNNTNTSFKITIAKKKVIVTSKLDGAESYNTTITLDGVAHNLTGTYKDVYGQTKDATIKYYTDSACTTAATVDEKTKGVIDVGTYFALITIEGENGANYEVGNSGNPVKFVITKGYLNIDLTAQEYSYTGAQQEFKIKTLTDMDEDYYSDGKFTIEYFKVNKDVVDYTSKTDKAPFQVGKYLVQITFANCTNFYDKNYDDTYITIVKAATKVETKTVTVTYDGDSHEFKLLDAELTVTANDGDTTVICVKNGAFEYNKIVNNVAVKVSDVSEVIELRYLRNGQIINSENPASYVESGEYLFRVAFKGDDCFDSSSTSATFVIEEAEFEGISFEGIKFNYVDSTEENYHAVVVEGDALADYIAKGAIVKYTYLGSDYKDKGDLAKDIKSNATWEYKDGVSMDEYPFYFNNVGMYTIAVVITLKNYKQFNRSVILEIDKAAMPKVTPVSIEEVYNGTFHPGKFTIDTTAAIKYYYLEGFESIEAIDYFTIGQDTIYVSYSEDAIPMNAGVYFGKIYFTSDSYADNEIEVMITITKKQVEKVSFIELQDIIDEIDSATDLSDLVATFKNAQGGTSEAQFEYYDADGNKVELNADGTLNPGTYTVKILFEDGNYYTEQEAEITIAQASTNKGGKGGDGSSFFEEYKLYIIIGGAVVVVIIVIVIIIVVAKNKNNKRGGRKGGKRKPRKPAPSGGARKPQAESIKKRPPEQTKKKSNGGIEDKAQF